MWFMKKTMQLYGSEHSVHLDWYTDANHSKSGLLSRRNTYPVGKLDDAIIQTFESFNLAMRASFFAEISMLILSLASLKKS
jgi:hypothetical protein